jgi:DMSO/TMAO reductase YedYZ heme-binding membrane subunit
MGEIMKKSALETNTLIYVIIGTVILLILIILAFGINNASFGIFGQMEDVLK